MSTSDIASKEHREHSTGGEASRYEVCTSAPMLVQFLYAVQRFAAERAVLLDPCPALAGRVCVLAVPREASSGYPRSVVTQGPANIFPAQELLLLRKVVSVKDARYALEAIREFVFHPNNDSRTDVQSAKAHVSRPSFGEAGQRA